MFRENLDHRSAAMELTEQMMQVADQGETICRDDSCFLIYGLIRDCAYKIRRTIGETSRKSGRGF